MTRGVELRKSQHELCMQVIAYLDTGKASPFTQQAALCFSALLAFCSGSFLACIHCSHILLDQNLVTSACSTLDLAGLTFVCSHLQHALGLHLKLPTAFTGSGKTLVSVLLIKDKAGGLNEGGVKRVTVFLAPKVLLVQQVGLVHAHLHSRAWSTLPNPYPSGF